MNHSLKRKTLFPISSFLICFLFYLFFAFLDGAVICVDSPSYINMHLSREPFYPILLAAFRALFPTQGNFYLTAVAFMQSLLAAFAAWRLANFLKKELALTPLPAFFVLAMPLATSLLCRFAAKRSSMYSNSILTEGIACSMFLLFTCFLLEYCFHPSRKALLKAGFLSFLMIATRKQMYLTLFLLVIAILYVSFQTNGIPAKRTDGSRHQSGFSFRQQLKVLPVLLGTVFGILLSNFALDAGYNYLLHGSFSTHSSDNRFLATMVFYTAAPEDAALISDPQVRELFQEIYDICDENGYLMSHAGAGWYQRVEHFGNHYDHIQIDTMWPMIQQYVHTHYSGSDAELEKLVDSFTQEIINALLPRVWPKILLTFTDNFLSGLITTVAQRRPVLIPYSLFIYLFYLALLIYNLKKEGLSRLSLLALYTLVSVLINVAIVSMVIFCQTRYTIYNMPLFYISFLLLLWNTKAGAGMQKPRIAK